MPCGLPKNDVLVIPVRNSFRHDGVRNVARQIQDALEVLLRFHALGVVRAERHAIHES